MLKDIFLNIEYIFNLINVEIHICKYGSDILPKSFERYICKYRIEILPDKC